ncbi:Metacaspase-1 [Hibiscus syriacus]|uniref:Metacaspase-1 n=1 Tax=Hibiscus syriacus TaxID=106335 RepID=A0A6A2YKJ8_HIBSY|nr:Metacaspase-1 [Hibiscus syriacus]
MENRLVCRECRQKFSASTTAETVICPRCLANPVVLTAIGFGTSSDRFPKTCGLDKAGEWVDKRSVLCGVSYNKWKHKLKGIINDVFNMKTLLIEQYKYKEENMLLLTEEQPDARLIPTKANIENCLKWLVKDCKSGDSLVFYYSGHGLRKPNFENEELDGFDQTICPVDFLKEGMILDNDIYETIVKPFTDGVKLHAVVDASHSGTILDLEHFYDRKKKEWTDNKPPSGKRTRLLLTQM